MIKGKGPNKRHLLVLGIWFLLAPSPALADTYLAIFRSLSPEPLWQGKIAPGESFSLVHRNSIYGVLVWEAFQADDQGVIWLKGLKTESPAVLEYYGLEASTSDWILLTRKLGTLFILPTSAGDFRLSFNQETVALSQLAPEGTPLEIRIVQK